MYDAEAIIGCEDYNHPVQVAIETIEIFGPNRDAFFIAIGGYFSTREKYAADATGYRANGHVCYGAITPPVLPAL